MILSKNAIALVVLALSTIGLNVADTQVIDVISAIGTIISFALMVINQIDRKEVSNFFWKDKK